MKELVTMPSETITRLKDTTWGPSIPGLEEELKRELAQNPRHPLHNVPAISAARRNGLDYVLFLLDRTKLPLVVVHLTYNVETSPEWPAVAFYSDWEDWLQYCVIPDETP